MKRYTVLEKKAKEAILDQISELGEITTESVMDLVRPHYNFDPQKAFEKEIRRKANNLMSTFKDDKGVRACFNLKGPDGESKYINIDTTKDLLALTRVEAQMDRKYFGLNRAKLKITRRKQDLMGQIKLPKM